MFGKIIQIVVILFFAHSCNVGSKSKQGLGFGYSKKSLDPQHCIEEHHGTTLHSYFKDLIGSSHCSPCPDPPAPPQWPAA